MLPSEHLQAVKWLYNYTTQLDNMIGDQSMSLAMELDGLIDRLMDAHEEASKARIISWLSNILANEQKINPSINDDGYYMTSGPQDLFINVNALIDHSVNQSIGDKALFRISVMYAQCLLYFQECLKRFLSELETIEILDDQLTNQTTNQPLKPSINQFTAQFYKQPANQSTNPSIKPTPYLLAMINNTQSYDDNTEEFRTTCAQSFNQLTDQLLDDWDDLIDDVQAGWFDVAIAACEVLIKRAMRPLLPSFSALYHSAHVLDENFFKNQLIKPISEAYASISRSINRPAFVKHFIQQICVTLINMYTRAFLSGASKQVSKGVDVSTVLKNDIRTIEQFYRDWANHMPDDVLHSKLALLNALYRLISAPKLTITSAASLIQPVRDALVQDPIVPAYSVVSLVLSEIRRDVTSAERKSMMIEFTDEERAAAAEIGKLSRNVSLTDLSMSASTVTYELSITVQSARDLVIKDSTASDPYVMVYLFEGLSATKPIAVRRTKHINQSLNPNWNITFDDFTSAEASSFTSIVFEVWDQDMLNSEFMGKAELTVGQIRKQKLLTLQSPQLNLSGLPLAPSSSQPINNSLDKLSVTFTLPLKPREKSLRPGATPDNVKGDLTVKIMYYSKPVPVSRPLVHANSVPAKPSINQPTNQLISQQPIQPIKPTPTPTKPVSSHHPQMLNLSTDAIMNKLDTSPDTLTSPSMPSEAKQRSMFDRVMRKTGKRLVKEDPAVAEEAKKAALAASRRASMEQQRREAEELAQRNKEIDAFHKDEIARLAGRQGFSKVNRTFKPARRWFGMKADSHAQMLKMREEQQMERKRRHEQLLQQERMANAKEKEKKQQSMLQSMGAWKLW